MSATLSQCHCQRDVHFCTSQEHGRQQAFVCKVPPSGAQISLQSSYKSLRWLRLTLCTAATWICLCITPVGCRDKGTNGNQISLCLLCCELWHFGFQPRHRMPYATIQETWASSLVGFQIGGKSQTLHRSWPLLSHVWAYEINVCVNWDCKSQWVN